MLVSKETVCGVASVDDWKGFTVLHLTTMSFRFRRLFKRRLSVKLKPKGHKDASKPVSRLLNSVTILTNTWRSVRRKTLTPRRRPDAFGIPLIFSCAPRVLVKTQRYHRQSLCNASIINAIDTGAVP